MNKNTRKKILITAIGVGAAGTLTYFVLNKAKEAQESQAAPESAESASQPKKKKLLPVLKKALPVKSNNTASTSKTVSVPVNIVSEPFVPLDIAKSLKEAGEKKDISKVLQLLQKMKSRADYNLVNKEFEKLKWWGNVSIVTALLNEDFESETDRQKIRKEFLRIGLVQDAATGKWSVPGNLSGLRLHKDIITLKTTYVIDLRNKKRIVVKPKTILGEKVTQANAMIYFKALDGKMYSVPSQDVSFV